MNEIKKIITSKEIIIQRYFFENEISGVAIGGVGIDFSVIVGGMIFGLINADAICWLASSIIFLVAGSISSMDL